MSSVRDVHAIAEEIRTLLTSAKHGQWDVVWEILGRPSEPRQPLILNCISEYRRWGVLHQAVYWNNYPVVKKLLKFSTSDISIKAKDGTNERVHLEEKQRRILRRTSSERKFLNFSQIGKQPDQYMNVCRKHC